MERRALHVDRNQIFLTRNSDILHAAVGPNERVMMCAQSGKCYSLNPVASHVWELLEKPKTIAQICVLVSEEFTVEAAICEHDILIYIETLIGNGLVQITAH